MTDELARIESCYGSVADYNRCRQEETEHNCEAREKASEKYERNRKKLEEAEVVIPYGWYGECGHCPYADCDTATCECDDCGHVICNAPVMYVCKTLKERFVELPEK